MTFLHKLARRLAGIPAGTIALSLLASCNEGSVQDYLGPDPHQSNLVSVSISPRDLQIPVGDSLRFEATGWLSTGKSAPAQVTWSASGGTITPNGWFRPDGVGEYRVRIVATGRSNLTDSVRVSSYNLVGGIQRLLVLPSVTAVPRGASQQFTAEAILNDGSTVSPTVAWSANAGTISPSGLFIASGNGGTAEVFATLGAGLAMASASIQIQPAFLSQLVLDPSLVTMETGETRQLTVAASWSDGGSALPSLIWSVEGGTLSSQNVYTAGTTPGSYRIIVTSPTFAKSDTALVWILPRLVGLRVTPSTASLAPGATQPLQARALRNDGSETPAGVQWSATGGTIGINGSYTAGTTAGQYRAVATLQGLNGQTFADTAWMTISAGSATLTQISVTPHAPSLTTGSSMQFSAAGSWSDGSSLVPAVSWSATGGSIDATGLYTAGETPGSYRVIARQSGGTRADTALLSVAAKLLTFRINPKIDTLVTGQSRQFSATLNWSDGQTHPVTIGWTTTGGAISSTGEYSPGALVGSFLVIAACSCGAADTAAVTVRGSNPPASPTLMSLSLSPHAVALALGGLQQFSPTGVWSDGSSGPVGVIYDATGGNISSAGGYVAGTVPGTYRIIATQQGGTRADTAAVTITPDVTLNQVVLNPPTVVLPLGGTQQFSVSGFWSDGSSTAPAVTYSATGGTIDANGGYAAGNEPGIFLVIATQQGGALADTSQVTVGPTLTQLVMNPSLVSVFPGSTQQFAVSASWSDGSSLLPPLKFFATGGTVSAGGLYTAGSIPGSYQVIVRHDGGTKADTSNITVPTLTGLTLSPQPATVPAGGSQLFSVSGTWSNGATTPPAVDYTATGGTINPAGLFVAGNSNGTFQVIAKHKFGTRADTSVVTISGAAPPPLPPPPGGAAPPALPALLDTRYVAPTGSSINVGVGGNLQNAINSASCGDQILLAAGATYTGNFVLPARQCGARPIHLRTAGPLPPEGIRVTPASAAGFAKIVSPDYQAAIQTASRSRGWRILAVEITVPPSLSLNYGLVLLEDGSATSRADLPGNIVIDRAYVHGNAAGHMKRGISLNSDSSAVVDSWLSDWHGRGQDTQAIGGWTGPGPYRIVNNYVEAAGENIMFGGAEPAIAGLTPSDIEIRRNWINKPLSWLTSDWTIKNSFEIKHAQRVLFEANVVTNNWAQAQAGFMIVIYSSGDSGPLPRANDITLRNNWLRGSGNGLNLGSNYGSSVATQRVLLENNVMEEIGRPDLPGEGKLVQILGGTLGLNDLVINHNTFLHSQAAGASLGATILIENSPGTLNQNLVITNNLFSAPALGLIGGLGFGEGALNAYSGTSWIFLGNALAAEPNEHNRFPLGNFFPSSMAVLGLDANLRLGSGSGLKGRATDGADVGANIDVLLAAIAGVVP